MCAKCSSVECTCRATANSPRATKLPCAKRQLRRPNSWHAWLLTSADPRPTAIGNHGGDMSAAVIGVIGGSGLYELLEDTRHEFVETIYGTPSSPVSLGQIGGRDVAFLTRHGTEHAVPPHLINYRANLAALDRLGVRTLITSSAVGSLRSDYRPGDLVLTDQFVDRTTGRVDTFVTGPQVSHTSLSEPYCPHMRHVAQQVLDYQGEQFHPTGTAVVIQGPRFS